MKRTRTLRLLMITLGVLTFYSISNVYAESEVNVEEPIELIKDVNILENDNAKAKESSLLSSSKPRGRRSYGMITAQLVIVFIIITSLIEDD